MGTVVEIKINVTLYRFSFEENIRKSCCLGDFLIDKNVQGKGEK